jgi:hypothetical protein
MEVSIEEHGYVLRWDVAGYNLKYPAYSPGEFLSDFFNETLSGKTSVTRKKCGIST